MKNHGMSFYQLHEYREDGGGEDVTENGVVVVDDAGTARPAAGDVVSNRNAGVSTTIPTTSKYMRANNATEDDVAPAATPSATPTTATMVLDTEVDRVDDQSTDANRVPTNDEREDCDDKDKEDDSIDRFVTRRTTVQREKTNQSKQDTEEIDGGGVGGRRGRPRRKRATAQSGTLGDIMSVGLLLTSPTDERRNSASTAAGGDVVVEDTSAITSLSERYGITHPLDRVALTANGNLQRLVSSYYDAPVSVVVDYCVRREPDTSASITATQTTTPTQIDSNVESMVWDRVVHLKVFEQTFCTAKSVITVYDPLCQQLVESGTVGLGQLFRYLDLLPEFTLLGAGKIDARTTPTTTTDTTKSSMIPPSLSTTISNGSNGGGGGGGGGGGFWREYRLDCNELSCQIHEEFCTNLWQLEPTAVDSTYDREP